MSPENLNSSQLQKKILKPPPALIFVMVVTDITTGGINTIAVADIVFTFNFRINCGRGWRRGRDPVVRFQ